MAAPSLSFSRATFAKLSPHPYLLANLASENGSVRTNGRAPLQPRELNVHTSSLSHAHGSSLVRMGDTTVICGVRGEILPVPSIPNYRPRTGPGSTTTAEDVKARGAADLKNYDLLVPNIELATGCAPQFLPGVPPTTLAQTLSTRVYSLLHSARLLDINDLEIWHRPTAEAGDDKMDTDGGDGTADEASQSELKAFWTLYIDLLFVSFDGNPFDAAWVAILSALRDTKLPAARWDGDREMIVCSRKEEPRQLTVSGLPVPCTSAVFQEKELGLDAAKTENQGRHWLLVDPDRLEETLCEEAVTMVVDRSTGETRVRSIEKHGGASLGPVEVRKYAQLAERRWEQVQKALS
ncbi:ribosomal protein S5 domain 2-like protein [Thozetella sp. PMI_491]|nr:ribosomal protein S5 domain 2-like protein [Thozetella sp. PMI_491]